MFKALLLSNLRFHASSDSMYKIPALGLDSIIAHINQNLFEVRALDLIVASNNPRAYFREIVKSYKPDIIGFNAIVFTYSEAIELAKIAKSINNKILIVLGGYHATLDSKNMIASLDLKLFDFVMRGEADFSFNALLKAVFFDEDFSSVPNLSYFRNGEIIHNPIIPVNLAQLNLPDRSKRIVKTGYHFFGFPADIIEFSRGCIYDCGFCTSNQMYGKQLKFFEIERIIEDLRDTKRRGAKAIFVADDNVTLNMERSHKLFERIINDNLNMYYSVQASVKGILSSPEIPALMAKAGVKWVLLGIETNSEMNINLLNKSVLLKNTDAKIAVDRLKQQGILVIGTFIIGLPDDDENSLKASYAYAKKIKPDIAVFLPITPYPGTPLREELSEQKLITNYNDYSKYDLIIANVRTKYLEAETIQKYGKDFTNNYIVDSGSLFRMIKLFPRYIIKLIINEIRKNPSALIDGIKTTVRKFFK